MCDDFILFNDSLLNVDSVQNYSKNNSIIYDENSELTLYDNTGNTYFITSYSDFVNLGESILNKTLVISPKSTFMSPCFYMYKEITNNKIYDLANYIVSETSYLYVSDRFHYFSPVFDAERTKKLLEVDDNWKYDGKFYKHVDRGSTQYLTTINRVNEMYNLLYKSGNVSKQNSDYYFTNENYNFAIIEEIQKLVEMLISENMDLNDSKVDKILDKKINEFIMNFYVHFM